MGLLDRWDRRNQRWADRMRANPPPEPNYAVLAAAFGLLALLSGPPWGIPYVLVAVALVVHLVRKRRRAS